MSSTLKGSYSKARGKRSATPGNGTIPVQYEPCTGSTIVQPLRERTNLSAARIKDEGLQTRVTSPGGAGSGEEGLFNGFAPRGEVVYKEPPRGGVMEPGWAYQAGEIAEDCPTAWPSSMNRPDCQPPPK